MAVNYSERVTELALVATAHLQLATAWLLVFYAHSSNFVTSLPLFFGHVSMFLDLRVLFGNCLFCPNKSLSSDLINLYGFVLAESLAL